MNTYLHNTNIIIFFHIRPNAILVRFFGPNGIQPPSHFFQFAIAPISLRFFQTGRRSAAKIPKKNENVQRLGTLDGILHTDRYAKVLFHEE